MLFLVVGCKQAPGVEGGIEVVCYSCSRTADGVDVQEVLAVCALAEGSGCRA